MDNDKIDNIGCWIIILIILFSWVIFRYIDDQHDKEKELIELRRKANEHP